MTLSGSGSHGTLNCFHLGNDGKTAVRKHDMRWCSLATNGMRNHLERTGQGTIASWTSDVPSIMQRQLAHIRGTRCNIRLKLYRPNLLRRMLPPTVRAACCAELIRYRVHLMTDDCQLFVRVLLLAFQPRLTSLS